MSQRMDGATTRLKAVRTRPKQRFIESVEHLGYGRLHDPVADGGNPSTAPLTWLAPFGDVGAPHRLRPVVSGGEITGKVVEDVLIHVFLRLPIHTWRPTPFVSADLLPDHLEKGVVAHHLQQLAKPLGWIGRCHLTQMFQVSMWVSHEVSHLWTHRV
jgi:hypothetical protein